MGLEEGIFERTELLVVSIILFFRELIDSILRERRGQLNRVMILVVPLSKKLTYSDKPILLHRIEMKMLRLMGKAFILRILCRVSLQHFWLAHSIPKLGISQLSKRQQ